MNKGIVLVDMGGILIVYALVSCASRDYEPLIVHL